LIVAGIDKETAGKKLAMHKNSCYCAENHADYAYPREDAL